MIAYVSYLHIYGFLPKRKVKTGGILAKSFFCVLLMDQGEVKFKDLPEFKIFMAQ